MLHEENQVFDFSATLPTIFTTSNEDVLWKQRDDERIWRRRQWLWESQADWKSANLPRLSLLFCHRHHCVARALECVCRCSVYVYVCVWWVCVWWVCVCVFVCVCVCICLKVTISRSALNLLQLYFRWECRHIVVSVMVNYCCVEDSVLSLYRTISQVYFRALVFKCKDGRIRKFHHY